MLCYTGTREAFRPFIRIKELDLLLTTAQSIVWWDSAKKAPKLYGIALLIILMLGVSSPKLDLEITTDALHKFNFPVTGWNQYYAEHKRKYAPTLTVKKTVATPSKPVNPRRNDMKKLFTSEDDYQVLKEKAK